MWVLIVSVPDHCLSFYFEHCIPFLKNACLESKNVLKWRKGHFFLHQHRFQNESLFTDRMTEGGRW